MTASRTDHSPPSPVLIVTRDDPLREELLRLTAAAGTAPEVADDVGAGVRGWQQAALVLLGADLVHDVARWMPVRRSGVHLVACGRVAEPELRSGLALGVDSVAELPAAADRLGDTLTELGDGGPRGGVVIGVASGCGGAGATTFAAALAQRAARGAPSLVVDLDPWGGGIEHLLGFGGLDGARWDSLARTNGRLGARALREALPRRGDLGVLAWPEQRDRAGLPPTAVREVLAAARRGHDTVVVDLGRPGHPGAAEPAERCDLVLLLVPVGGSAVAAAARAATGLPRERLAVVVRGLCPDPAAIERRVGAPVRVVMADQRGLEETVALGAGPLRTRGPLARGVRDALALVERSRSPLR